MLTYTAGREKTQARAAPQARTKTGAKIRILGLDIPLPENRSLPPVAGAGPYLRTRRRLSITGDAATTSGSK